MGIKEGEQKQRRERGKTVSADAGVSLKEHLFGGGQKKPQQGPRLVLRELLTSRSQWTSQRGERRRSASPSYSKRYYLIDGSHYTDAPKHA